MLLHADVMLGCSDRMQNDDLTDLAAALFETSLAGKDAAASASGGTSWRLCPAGADAADGVVCHSCSIDMDHSPRYTRIAT